MRHWLILAGLLILAGTGCSKQPAAAPTAYELPHDAFSKGDFAAAKRLAEAVPPEDPLWPDAQMILALVALQSQDVATALEHFRAIPRNGIPVSLSAAEALADLDKQHGRLQGAIESYRYILQHRPTNTRIQTSLADLYAATGQRRLADELFTELIKLPEFEFKHLVMFTDFERQDPQNVQYLQRCAQSAPEDPAVNLGLAIGEIAAGKHAEARQRLESVVAAEPTMSAAQGLLGELLVDAGDEALQRWHAGLPDAIQDDPEIWTARGLWAQQRGQDRMAARCFWEAARKLPTSYRAMNQLALALAPLDPTLGPVFSERANQIYELRQTLSTSLNSNGKDEAAFRQVVTLLMQLGREWEALSWAVMGTKLFPQATWIKPLLERLPLLEEANPPRIRDSANLFVQHEMSDYPGFQAFSSDALRSGADAAETNATSGIRFEEQAAAAGLHFRYHHGHVAGVPGVRMQESTGGGVGVLDYDGDGWPDLFLTQGLDWPANADRPVPSDQYRDRLFRNRGEGFQDVTVAAHLPPDVGFGQGCAAGDFNNDGFVDLYVANIGVNQLLLNVGDGTFVDATAELHLATAAWTSSCLIADLNADGLPDLFDSNYVEGELLYRKICTEQNCTPQEHKSAPDALSLSQGDGTVQPFELGGEERWGAGLGVVAFRIDRAASGVAPAAGDGTASSPAASTAGRLSLFIANDHEPNFFLVNAAADNPQNLSLLDEAFVRGLAVNQSGKPTACMGVASGDLNGDGLLDLFVTNYKGEANNLYQQSAGGYFADAISGSGLMAAGLPYVGWGTQCLDADRDGRLDLVVANGHVGDFREAAGDYYMPTQFFHNRGDGQFAELSPLTVGPYFGQKILGRSVATLDWDRDGLTDFVLSPIAAPVALLTNRTRQAGHGFAVRLHATATARDAIGALVTVATPSGQYRQQLAAGDGFQASNERVLRFGLGNDETILSLQIEWPGGATQTLANLPADTLLDVVEGGSSYTLWRGTTPEVWR